jgi:hypothetical protein
MAVVSSTTMAATVAYWRFEQGPAGTNVQHGAGDGVFWPDLLDSSGNGNALSAWNSGQWQYRANVPYSTVPWTGATNTLSVKNVTGSPTMWNTSLANWEPAQWTIEATFKAEAGGWKDIVGRDSYGSLSKGTETNAALAGLYLQTTDNPAMGLAIKFVDKDGYWHSAELGNAYTGFTYSTDPDGNNAPWYTIAATSDGRYLRLYRYSHATPEKGYELIAETDMTVVNPGSTNTALDAGAGDGGDWDAGNITVGRGMYNGGHTDRFYGYIDEVRLSDRALSPSEFLLAPGYVQPVSPAQDEYLMSTAAISYTWETDIDLMTENEVVFDHYTLYVAGNATDLAGDAPTTYLHKQNIANVNTQSYNGYTGTYAYGEDYYWRIDMTTMDPNYADPNNVVNNIPVLYAGSPVRFFGPRACPAVTISGDVSNVPDPTTHIFTPANLVFTAGIARGTVLVDAIDWYKVNGAQDNLVTPDPLDPADTLISNVSGVTQIAFIPDLATATSTTLTVVSADPADNGRYYARVRLEDPLGGGTGCSGNSPTAGLFVRDDTHAGTDYLVHRYGFDGNANDSIGGAHGVVADAGTNVNYAFVDGQIQLTNTGLNSRPTQVVAVPAPTPEDPNATVNMTKLLEQEGAYVDLPNGIVSALGKSATFMAWFTYKSADSGNWPRIFDLGTSTGGEGFSTGGDGVQYLEGDPTPYLDTTSEDLQEYIMFCPKRDAGPGWRVESVVRPATPTSSIVDPASNTAIAGGVEACVAVSYDATAGKLTVYVNGVQIGEATNLSQHDLANINDVNNWLGRSQWQDAMFSGKINEFRIYDVALSKHWIKAYYEQGPDDYTTTPNPCIEESPNPMDFNTDCVVDMLDFAAFAAQWLNCNSLNCD